MKPLQVGELVEHSAWGRGKIVALDHQNADVYFPSRSVGLKGRLVKVRLTMLERSEVQVDPAWDRPYIASTNKKAGGTKFKMASRMSRIRNCQSLRGTHRLAHHLVA